MSIYNQFPIEYREISENEFTRIYFHYCFDPVENRQMLLFSDGTRSNRMIPARLFSISGTKRKFLDDGLGVILYNDYNSGTWRLGFAKFGKQEDWIQFESDFSAQFRGDNS